MDDSRVSQRCGPMYVYLSLCLRASPRQSFIAYGRLKKLQVVCVQPIGDQNGARVLRYIDF